MQRQNTRNQKPSQAKSKTPTKKRKPPPDPEYVRDTSIRPPRLVPGGIYSASDIMHNLGICRETLLKWKRSKTERLQPLNLGTKEEFYSGSIVIEFLCRYNPPDKG